MPECCGKRFAWFTTITEFKLADNIIFLDFDGVMHPVGSCVWDADQQKMHAQDAFRWWPHLERALESSPEVVYLVVHSTWRLMWETDDELLAMLPLSMRPYVLGCTDRQYAGRERSIEMYVEKHGITNFVVLDDEPKAFAKDFARLISCDGAQGLSQMSVVQALTDKLRSGLW